MKLSDGEKLIILMLNDLYRSNNVKSDFEPDFLDNAIRENHLWSIAWKYPGIEFDSQDSDTPPLVKEVLDYLDMWAFIEASYKRLSDEDKERLKQLEPVFGDNPTFEGFDGNNESRYLTTATFIINELDRFTEFSDRYLNSHGPSIDGYKRMLAVYKKEMEKNNYNLLDTNSLSKILYERTHPSRR